MKNNPSLKARKTLRERLIAALETADPDASGCFGDSLAGALVRKAAAGDTKAFEVIRDTIGEKPGAHSGESVTVLLGEAEVYSK